MKAWVTLALAVALFVAMVGAFHAYGGQQYRLGENTERLAWTQRENTQLALANDLIEQLQQEARDREQKHAQALAVVSTQYQKDLQHETASRDRLIADLRSGRVQLRIPIAAAACAAPADAGDATAPGAAAGGRDGAQTAELSGTVAEALVGLASDADAVVHQLTACQAVIEADRQAGGALEP